MEGCICGQKERATYVNGILGGYCNMFLDLADVYPVLGGGAHSRFVLKFMPVVSFIFRKKNSKNRKRKKK